MKDNRRAYIEIYKIINNKSLNVSNCSGFENFIIYLALRLSIVRIANIPLPNFIAIDEGFSSMDNTNIHKIEILLNKMRHIFDFVLIISHLEQLKSNCDKYINITKNNYNSPSYKYKIILFII